MNEIDIDVNLTEKDIYDFQKRVLYLKLPPVIIAIIFVILIAAASFSIVDVLTNNGNITYTILLLIPIFFLVTLPKTLKESSKKAISTNKFLQKTRNYIVNMEGICVTSDTSKSYIKWSELYKALETNEGFLLFIDTKQVFIIPKRCFKEDIEQIEFFRKSMMNAPVPIDTKKRTFIKRFKIGCLAYILIVIVIAILMFVIQTRLMGI